MLCLHLGSPKAEPEAGTQVLVISLGGKSTPPLPPHPHFRRKGGGGAKENVCRRLGLISLETLWRTIYNVSQHCPTKEQESWVIYLLISIPTGWRVSSIPQLKSFYISLLCLLRAKQPSRVWEKALRRKSRETRKLLESVAGNVNRVVHSPALKLGIRCGHHKNLP